MAKLKPRSQPAPSAPGRDVSASVRIPLRVVVDPERGDLAALSPVERGVWLDARARVGNASLGGPFDPRAVLGLESRAFVEWRARRLTWLIELFADDAQIVCGGLKHSGKRGANGSR